MSRVRFLKNSIPFVWVVLLVCCLLVVAFSVLRLPELPLEKNSVRLYPTSKYIQKIVENDKLIGELGEMMIDMLPQDLAFTVFLPSEKALERDLGLLANGSLTAEKMNDTYAIVTRILGFSAIPRKLASVSLPLGKENLYESISGFMLYVLKDVDGMLVVNRVRSKRVDIRMKESIVHIMDGVVMDAEFEESVQPDNQGD